ncbi:hypothetical protein ACIRL2_41410 [Embleya sp. NPDC127516]|uniref:hypothetical protein n=1 Tax=Embleya sp. NPDC127516 TaxID=3363990 RepID=UPI0038116271
MPDVSELQEVLDAHGIRSRADVTTAAEFCRRAGLHRSRVNAWRTRGYIALDGTRVHVEPIAERPSRSGRRPTPIYATADLEAAELATRLRAPDRANPCIAGWQRIKRAERRAT